jgi:hypothetical protein
MRIRLALAAAFLLTSCSEAPPPAKAPEKPSAPITGRQAFQMTYPQARIWAADCQPIHIRSLNLPDPKSEQGKAGAWEIQYVSQTRGRSKTFSWSAIEAEGNLHKGVYGAVEEAWSGPSGQEKPFSPAALLVDTPDALATAVENSAEYLKKPGDKPQVTFLCDFTPRFPDPVWRVLWGDSVSSAQWSIFIDATTGRYVGR